jgi:hypothetical protein
MCVAIYKLTFCEMSGRLIFFQCFIWAQMMILPRAINLIILYLVINFCSNFFSFYIHSHYVISVRYNLKVLNIRHIIKNFLTHNLWVLHDLAPYITFLNPTVRYLWQLNGKWNEVFALPPYYYFSLKEIAFKKCDYLSKVCPRQNLKPKIYDMGASVRSTVGRKLEINMVGLPYIRKLIVPSLMKIFHFVQKSLKVPWYLYTGRRCYH